MSRDRRVYHQTFYIMSEASVLGKKKDYGVSEFFLDALLTIFTSGLWLIWIFIREMRK